MRQILLLGNVRQWYSEVQALTDLFYLTGIKVITFNIGATSPLAIDRKDKVKLTLTDLHGRGMIDGLMAIVDEATDLDAIEYWLDALPYGTPKLLLIHGATPRRKIGVITICLPGQGHNLNPIISTALGDAVFALSGMTLCNQRNFPASKPSVALINCLPQLGRFLTAHNIDYIHLSSSDGSISMLAKQGLIQGLVLGDGNALSSITEIANSNNIPIIVNTKQHARLVLPHLYAAKSPTVVVTSPKNPIPSSTLPPWVKIHSMPQRHTEEYFLRFAQLTSQLLDSSHLT